MDTRFNPNEVNLDPSYCRFGSEVLAKLLKTIEAQMNGVEKSEDIEYVHKMRVTSRRIRAAMPLFKECFPKKKFKKWLNEIKKVTQFLGSARDLDVQIEFIKNYIKFLQTSEPKTGIDTLLQTYIDQRKTLQSNVINGLEELEEGQVLNDISKSCEQIATETASKPFNVYSVREKAFWQISAKLDEFLIMEDYVHRENEILKHHEMRIRAKWLRYTMECFAPLHPEEFSKEIEMMKNFQDTLGEMHDCDVWIERIPKFINEVENEKLIFPEKQPTAEENQSLLKFLEFIKEKRKNEYQKFVSSWDFEKSKNSFEELRKTASAGFVAAGYRTQAELANPYVKIAVMSDVYANLHALKAVIKDAESRGVTVFLNAGNMIEFGAFPNEVIQTLYSKNALSVTGNWDIEVLNKSHDDKGPRKIAVAYNRRTLAKSYETYLLTLPSKLEFEVGRKKLLMIHESPGSVDEHSEGNTPNQEILELAENSKADIIVFGNSSEQFNEKNRDVQLISPGSVGMPEDGDPRAGYAVITVNPFSVGLFRVNYDVEAAADALRRTGAPESYAQSLLRGLNLEDIIAEDKAKENDRGTQCALAVTSCRRIAEKYWPDTQHSETVTKFSLELFDALQKLHQLKANERCWLECAAVLHDVGLSQGTKAHHKSTLRLILNDTQFPFTSTERPVIANIARYHRKGCPKNSNYNFMSLSRELRRKVTMLASILRLADALDSSHGSIVQNIEVQVNFDNVTVLGLVFVNPILEEQDFNKKKDSFEKSFAEKIILKWKYQPKTVDSLAEVTDNGETTTPKLPETLP